MKKIFLLATLVYLTGTSFGQITITKSDMPVAKDTARYSTSNTILNFDTTGAGIVWDYSSLVATGQGVDSFEPALTISNSYGLYFGFTTDYGVSAANINLGTATITNVYDFYKTSNSDLQINAIGGQYTGVTLPSLYTIPDKVYQFPLSYGRIDTSNYDVNISVIGTGSVHKIGTRINTVDGWGTVITPYDTFQCIRLKSVVTEVDSTTITLLGITFPTTTNTTSYKWLANGVIIPVLEVDGTVRGNTFTPTSEKYRDSVRFIPPQFNITVNFTASKTVCTTRDTVIFTPTVRQTGGGGFGGGNVAGTTYLYSISPNTYNYVAGTDSTTQAPSVNFTAQGLYSVSLSAASPAGGSVPATATTTKVDYIVVSFPAGIQTLSASGGIRVYPNPVNDHISCLLSGDANSMATIELMDIKGSVLYTVTTSQHGEITIPTANIAAGDYLLRATPVSGAADVQKVSIVH